MATKKPKAFEPSEDFNDKSQEWMQLSETLSTGKAREIILRNELIAMIYPKGNIPKGTNSHMLGEGWVVKVAGKENAKVDETLVADTRALIEAKVKAGEVLAFDLDEVIKYKPELSVSAWNSLTAEQQHLVRNCVTFTPGQAGLEITKPKRAVK
ncbi:hypothetical protein GUH47_02630 [Xanthomonas citri pv. citri]|nr:putative DNA binding protein [Achromobacter phage vB_Ade_ART]MBD4204906.1 hypothetical protein [Xanthomonas citri pv. citri]